MPFGFHLAMDTLPSGVPPKELPLPLSGQRGITPAFGYDAPHLGVRGTSTLLSNVLLSTHYAAVRLLGDVHTGRTASAFARRPADLRRHPRGLPVPVQKVSRMSGVYDYAGPTRDSRYRPGPCCLPLSPTASAS